MKLLFHFLNNLTAVSMIHHLIFSDLQSLNFPFQRVHKNNPRIDD